MLREAGVVRSNRAIPTSKIKACREFRVIALSLCPTLCPTKVSVQLLFLAFLAVLGIAPGGPTTALNTVGYRTNS